MKQGSEIEQIIPLTFNLKLCHPKMGDASPHRGMCYCPEI